MNELTYNKVFLSFLSNDKLSLSVIYYNCTPLDDKREENTTENRKKCMASYKKELIDKIEAKFKV
jgi:hypothetical protein